MVKKFFLFISFILISNAILAQNDGYLELLGTIMQEGKGLEGVDITILKGSEKIDNPLITAATGNFMVNLPFGFDYKVVVSKNGFATKSFLVNTKVPDSEKKQIFSFKFKLDLIKNSENNNQINKANQPIAKLAYDNEYADFDYDANFVNGNDAQSTETPKVSNIVAEQVGQTIHVYYILNTPTDCLITIFYSDDNEATWHGPLIKVSGDVGSDVSSGFKKIIWNVTEELSRFVGNEIKFKIEANIESLPPTTLLSETTDDMIFTYAEEMPLFVNGGEAAMYSFIQNNLRYPQMAIETGITGTVFVNFVVDKNGDATKIKVIRGIGGACDEEAVRIIKSMPKFIPGVQNGRRVNVSMNVFVKFQLK